MGKDNNDLIICSTDTGEIVTDEKYRIVDITDKVVLSKTRRKINYPAITKEDLVSGNLEIRTIYDYLRNHGELNKFGFMKIYDGCYVNNELFKIGSESGFGNEISKLITLVSIRNRIKTYDNSYNECRNWNEIYEALSIKNRNKMSEFKRVLIKYDLVRQITTKNSKMKLDSSQMVLNPNYFRYGTHVSQVSIVAFRDVSLSKIHPYNTFYLYLQGMIGCEDIL